MCQTQINLGITICLISIGPEAGGFREIEMQKFTNDNSRRTLTPSDGKITHDPFYMSPLSL